MSNEEIAQVFRDVYNGWWLKWREAPLTDDHLDQAAEEGYQIIRTFGAEPLVVYMVNELVRILERRAQNGAIN